MKNKAETFTPSALLKVVITDKGVGSLDFCEVGEIKLKLNGGLSVSMRWDINDKAAIYKDKNGYTHIDWYLEKFDQKFFERSNPITRPNWSYLVTGDITDMSIDIFHSEDSTYIPNPVAMHDIKLEEFNIVVKEEDGSIAMYPFLEEQLHKFMEEGNHNATISL